MEKGLARGWPKSSLTMNKDMEKGGFVVLFFFLRQFENETASL